MECLFGLSASLIRFFKEILLFSVQYTDVASQYGLQETASRNHRRSHLVSTKGQEPDALLHIDGHS